MKTNALSVAKQLGDNHVQNLQNCIQQRHEEEQKAAEKEQSAKNIAEQIDQGCQDVNNSANDTQFGYNRNHTQTIRNLIQKTVDTNWLKNKEVESFSKTTRNRKRILSTFIVTNTRYLMTPNLEQKTI